MKTIYLIAIACILSLPSVGLSNVCVVEGERETWVTNYCLIKYETSNVKSNAIKECVKTEDAQVLIVSCEGNILLKRKICELLIERGQHSGDINACVKDEFDINEYINNDV